MKDYNKIIRNKNREIREMKEQIKELIDEVNIVRQSFSYVLNIVMKDYNYKDIADIINHLYNLDKY